VVASDCLELWDIPPRKPQALFTVAVAVGAVPLALLARWRVGRLRRAAG
jgi:hypothetical protein